ncbi:unnamed protein product [Amoebophrya sp. A25]|nr:unnamed protein product [Amoebophrya sp. A25]|eukprot:GSA25T00000571001.1
MSRQRHSTQERGACWLLWSLSSGFSRSSEQGKRARPWLRSCEEVRRAGWLPWCGCFLGPCRVVRAAWLLASPLSRSVRPPPPSSLFVLPSWPRLYVVEVVEEG